MDTKRIAAKLQRVLDWLRHEANSPGGIGAEIKSALAPAASEPAQERCHGDGHVWIPTTDRNGIPRHVRRPCTGTGCHPVAPVRGESLKHGPCSTCLLCGRCVDDEIRDLRTRLAIAAGHGITFCDGELTLDMKRIHDLSDAAEGWRGKLTAAERMNAGKCPHCGGSGPPHLGCAQHVEMIRKTFIGSYQREVDDLRARLAAAEQDWWDLYAEKLTVMDDLRRRAEMAERERDEEEEIVWKTVCDACNEFLPQPALYDHSPVELIYRIGEQRDEFQQRLATLEAAVRDASTCAEKVREAQRRVGRTGVYGHVNPFDASVECGCSVCELLRSVGALRAALDAKEEG